MATVASVSPGPALTVAVHQFNLSISSERVAFNAHLQNVATQHRALIADLNAKAKLQKRALKRQQNNEWRALRAQENSTPGANELSAKKTQLKQQVREKKAQHREHIRQLRTQHLGELKGERQRFTANLDTRAASLVETLLANLAPPLRQPRLQDLGNPAFKEALLQLFVKRRPLTLSTLDNSARELLANWLVAASVFGSDKPYGQAACRALHQVTSGMRRYVILSKLCPAGLALLEQQQTLGFRSHKAAYASAGRGVLRGRGRGRSRGQGASRGRGGRGRGRGQGNPSAAQGEQQPERRPEATIANAHEWLATAPSEIQAWGVSASTKLEAPAPPAAGRLTTLQNDQLYPYLLHKAEHVLCEHFLWLLFKSFEQLGGEDSAPLKKVRLRDLTTSGAMSDG